MLNTISQFIHSQTLRDSPILTYLCTAGGLLGALGFRVVPCCCRLAVLKRASRLIGAVPGVVPAPGSS